MKLYNIKKNLNNICFVLTQPGSIFYLNPIIDKIKFPNIFVDKKISKSCIGKFKFKILNKKNLNKIFKYDVIITNLTQYDYLEKEILRLKKEKNYLIQFLDNWNFVKERLYYSNINKKFPNEIWALDHPTNLEIKKVCKNKNIKFKHFPHPGITNIQKNKYKISSNEKIKKVLIVLQPLNSLYLNNKHIKFKFSQKDLLEFFTKFIKINKNYKFKFALHPLMKTIKNSKLSFIRLKDVSEILSYNFVIGFFSTILSTSIKLNIPSGILKLKNEKYYLSKNIKKFFYIKNHFDLEQFLSKKIIKSNKIKYFNNEKILKYIYKLN
tara:strand:- start:10422 stop:11390 length:969 start_codon:yes stop_codon:yes gene_type:complete